MSQLSIALRLHRFGHLLADGRFDHRRGDAGAGALDGQVVFVHHLPRRQMRAGRPVTGG